MALTPEDVLNKRFTATQFRRGYDEQEVDDFLDEVVAELRRLTQERDDLGTQLADCRKGQGAGPATTDGRHLHERADRHRQGPRAERAATAPSRRRRRRPRVSRRRVPRPSRRRRTRPSASPGPATPPPGPRPSRPTGCGPPPAPKAAVVRRTPRARPMAPTRPGSEAPPVPPVSSPWPRSCTTSTSPRGTTPGTGSSPRGRSTTTGWSAEAQTKHDELVASAQRRHDELLETGQKRHDELLDTAQRQHDELIAEATTRHDTMIREARDQSTGMVGQAQQQKQAILGELGQRARPAAEEDRRAALVRAQLPGQAEVLPRVPAAGPPSRPGGDQSRAPRGLRGLPGSSHVGTSRARPSRAEVGLVPPRRAPTRAGRRPACARWWRRRYDGAAP